MAIIIKDNVFTLQTKNSTYQMKADSKGILLHTYYGRKTDETDYSYMISMADRGFSGNIYEAREDRTHCSRSEKLASTSILSALWKQNTAEFPVSTGTAR